MASAILGIGLNLTQNPGDFSAELRPTATSLKIQKKRVPSREILLQDILSRLEEAYGWVREGRFHRVLIEWRKRSILSGKQVKVVLGGRSFFAQVQDVDERGALLVRTDVGIVERLTVGEVETLRLKPPATPKKRKLTGFLPRRREGTK
jgi:BirA family biotin operon repressor/biotin-[acetyl-CoA-carboxylase] ligase